MKEFLICRHRLDAVAPDERRTLVRIDDSGTITYADAYADAVLGYDPHDLVGKSLSCLAATRQDDPLGPVPREAFERGESALLTLRHHEGFFFTARFAVRVAIADADQAATAAIQPRGQDPLDPRLLHMAEASGQLGIWQLETYSNEMTWSDGLYRLFDLRPGSDMTPEHALFYFQEYQQRVRALFRRCIRWGTPFTRDLHILTAKQRLRPVRLTGQPLRAGEKIVAVAGTLVDLSERLHQRQARTEIEQVLQGVMAATEDLVLALEPNHHILALNDAMADQFESTFGLRPRVGDDLTRLLADFPNERRLAQRLWGKAMSRDQFTVEMPLAQQERELPIYEVRFHRLKDRKGHTLGAVHLARDITRRINTGDNLDYLSRHDPMTGLLNRRELLHRLQRAIDKTGDESPGHALLYIDLDHVTRFNETAGAGACDRYLRELAALLGSRIRQRDALARVSADKFALLLDTCAEPEARRVAQALTDQIKSFMFEWQGYPLQTTASGGLVPFAPGCGPSAAEELLTLAADLCQTAKNAGRDRIHVHRDPGSTMLESEAQKRLGQLQDCVREERITLMYQTMRPVTSVTWGEHIEILARLEHEGAEGFWLPNDFLPVAERFDLAQDIDRRVIRKTLDWLRQHPRLEPRLKLCSFNLSLASVLDEEFAHFLSSELARINFSADRFCFEIRETDATQHPDKASIFCDMMHELGCKVALDGAGASMQSYGLAARLPVDIIKLDRSLMGELHEDPVQQVMVEALHRIAVTAGKTTVATFIESDETLRQVRRLGVHFGQGFRLSPPRPLEELAPATVDVLLGRRGL
ncbi:sensor domain-containing protein [Marinobacter fonticola]|uniref:sensor domain-containing protein n=1 Tax=Marinobacter fonticola TaxID=2603215 RepID=UPI0011E6A408|nr:EAL domain-containing protein [Marinobacter fonticola]